MTSLSKQLRAIIAKEAKHRCGYYLTEQRISGAQMQIEHIIPQAKGGSSEQENLWLSCAWCNSFKGVQIQAIDPKTENLMRLFNPRQDNWFEHFVWI